MFFSVVIPVYNRPEEIDELLQTLNQQSYTDFEVLIVEDGSENDCEHIVNQYRDNLDISYFYKENSGQGFSRNYGFKRANGDYFVVFDSDCLIPSHYFKTVNQYLQNNWLDAYGGPDKAHGSFSPLQKAISYSMTSPLTTGGIRGKNKSFENFLPRGFNMGLSSSVFDTTDGFNDANRGEDIELSIRIKKAGLKVGLIEEAFVYHKRKATLRQFYDQAKSFGQNRIFVSRSHPEYRKAVHWLPTVFLILEFFYLFLLFFQPHYFKIVSIPVVLYFTLIIVHSTLDSKNISVGFLSIVTSVTQLSAYGWGFISALVQKKWD